MRTVIVNFAIIFSIIGFVGYLFIILASFFGCCAGLTSLGFHKIIMALMGVAVILFITCMINNCCKIRKSDNA